MKYISEYRNAAVAAKYLRGIQKMTSQSWSIMEICGGQTHSLVKNGIIDLLPTQINLVHGPGCPVCVTPITLIDLAIQLSEKENVILCSFGDMLRVPGAEKNLLQAKAEGADVRILYSPLDAVKIAKENPGNEVIFFAVGFETTAPANALAVIQAESLELHNFSILSSHVLVPPAMEAILSDKQTKIDGFLAAGHVCTIMGLQEYKPISDKYKVPIVSTGFEPVDLLQGIYMVIKQLEEGRFEVENQYGRVVDAGGNHEAKHLLKTVFHTRDSAWRGIGTIPNSGYALKDRFREFDAIEKFDLTSENKQDESTCIAGEILKGVRKPYECPHFRASCTPESPIGAPMVSSEGACAAYYHYSSNETTIHQ